MIIIFILLVAIGVYWFVLRGEDPTPDPYTDVEGSNTQTPDDEDECGEWSDWSLCCGSTIPPGATVRRNGCTYDMRHLNGRTVLTPDDPCRISVFLTSPNNHRITTRSNWHDAVLISCHRPRFSYIFMYHPSAARPGAPRIQRPGWLGGRHRARGGAGAGAGRRSRKLHLQTM